MTVTGIDASYYYAKDLDRAVSFYTQLFAVPDVAEAVAELKARGVPFHGAIEDTPVCHMAFGTDPEGNGFILHMRK